MKLEYRKINGKTLTRPATVIIDWNNTLVSQDWDGPYTFLEGACKALRALLTAGYTVKVHSLVLHSKDWCTIAPSDPQRRAKNYWYMRDALDSEGLQDVEIETEVDKIPAVWYIDDKNLQFDGNWPKIVRKVLRG